MAKKTVTVGGKTYTPEASFEVSFGKFTLRSDGKILRQHRIDGRLEAAYIVAGVKPGHNRQTAFAKYAAKYGGTVEAI